MTHRNPSYCLILLAVLFALPYFATAQTATQRGVARMITRSLTDPVKPVRGVSIVVGNSASKASDAQGRFSLNIVKNKVGSFQLTDVKLPKSSTLILASPSKKKTLFLSQDELAITFTTPEDQKAVSRTTYQRLKKQYDKQAQELIALRTQLENQQTALQNNAAATTQLKARIDSIQTIINDYFDEKKRDYMLKELQRIADELALTDYQSLDSLERRIYDLRQAGEWQTISTLLHTLMHGNAAAWLSALASRADRAERDFQFGMDRLKDAIEAFKMQHLNDSVAHYYEILTRADSTNSENLVNAGSFELEYMARYNRARSYCEKALQYTDADTLKAHCYVVIGITYAYEEDYVRSKCYVQKAMEILQAVLGEQNPDVAGIYDILGAIYLVQNDTLRAKEYFQKALKIKLAISNENSLGVADSYNRFGNLYFFQEDYVRAEEYHRKALKIRLAISREGENSLIGVCYHNIGTDLIGQQDYVRAEEYIQKALKMHITEYGERHPNVATVYSSLGDACVGKTDYIHAVEYYQKALEIFTDVYGEQYSQIGIIYGLLGNAYMSQNDNSHAEEYYQKALKYAEKNQKAAASVYGKLSEVYTYQGDYVRAEEYAQKALKLQIPLLGELHMDVATSYNRLATIYCTTGDYARAEEYAKKALEIRLSIQGEQHADLVDPYAILGYAYGVQGNLTSAEECFQKALKITTATYGEQCEYVSTLCKRLSEVYEGKGDYARAEEYKLREIKVLTSLLGEQNLDVAKAYHALAMTQLEHSDYAASRSNLTKEVEILKAVSGKDASETLAAEIYLNNVSYVHATLNPDSAKTYMATHSVTAMIYDNTAASQRGLSGTYYVLAYDRWNVETDTTNLFTFMRTFKEKPKTLVFYRNGEIKVETFVGQIGIGLHIEQVTVEEKQRQVEAWRKWQASQFEQEQNTNDALIKLWEQRRKDKEKEQ